eukprot:Phypoly_transcript_12214.p1 GENE.Phypoly_transcript_12214~~Phypoly_transcript_12214.p1  ORF type:complete len:163 (+),score=3.70 Phypoly_transcript_12214:603-1091(+)
MSQEQVRLISIQRIAFLIKMICTLDFLFSIYSYVVRAVWLMGSLGFLMNPIAFYGAHTYRRRLILLYCGYLVVDTIFQFVYLFVNKEDKQTYVHTITILLCIFFIMTKGYIVYYVYSFYKILPSQGGWGRSLVIANDIALSPRSERVRRERETESERDDEEA